MVGGFFNSAAVDLWVGGNGGRSSSQGQSGVLASPQFCNPSVKAYDPPSLISSALRFHWLSKEINNKQAELSRRQFKLKCRGSWEDYWRDCKGRKALTTGMRQNQELQAQALSRSPEYPANELVKPGTTTLNPLPEATSTAESALKFQDWVEVSGAAMADVSEQSSEWRGSVTKVVEEAYTRWLSATPLERLNITVVGAKELNEGRWIRVNARVATMLLGSMQEDVKRSLLADRALTTGMRQNQELQAQALSRSPEYPANELVKPGTTTLNPLPEATSTAESALKFQDWVEVSGAAMADVSEQSSEWRGSVTKVVEEAYTRWLSATPLERLNITVVGAKELNEGRWIRVNARVATMLLGSMQEDVKRFQGGERDAPRHIGTYAGTSDTRCAGTSDTGYAGTGNLIYYKCDARHSMDLGDVGAGSSGRGPVPSGQRRRFFPREDQKPEMRVLNVRDVMVCELRETSSPLLDSGATQRLRIARSQDEWRTAEEVNVQLAGAASLRMRMDDKGITYDSPTRGVGEKTLGYTLDWAPTRCYLEAEALSLIARVEDRKREQMENSAQATPDLVTLATAMMEQTWMDFVIKYVRTGDTDDGRRALRDAPFLQGLQGECLNGLVQGNLKDKGWCVFKEIEYLSRPQRRKLWTARRWIVHVCSGSAGNPGHWEIFRLDQGSTAVIELDIQRCKSHDITRTSTWRLLMWGATAGKIDVVMGGPSGRWGFPIDMGRANTNDRKSMSIISRMRWLYAVSKEFQEEMDMTREISTPEPLMEQWSSGACNPGNDSGAMETAR
ncbi:hypothetical protein AK812_SmicGene18592 [Symbiodinium microadriaticum]|uniref:Uncharacterized protein n=1 Tax=Symbiodinium microadriaticum TaxID=2951 RepID=A0A1Q9DUQ8_SYMMI|nr:hypothetical protein AK812_SmicGene18592 [Symbiodinium microadriaticum]